MFANIDDYETHLRSILSSWSPEQRTALAAAMAERWLPVYASFSQAEDWGDPDGLRRSLEAVWSCILGRRLSPQDIARHRGLIEDATPHMDDFDANEALCACVMIQDALKCCQGSKNLDAALDAALSGFEAVAPDILLDEERQPRLWRGLAVRKERQKQQKLLDWIGALRQFNETAIRELRERMLQPDMAGQLPQPQPAAPPGISNQVAFDQYHRTVQSDLDSAARPAMQLGGIYAYTFIFAQWLNRYLRRLDTIAGNLGKLADTAACEILVARSRAQDAASPGQPDWDPNVREIIDLGYRNPLSRLDVRALEQPHGYGPSIRRLWLEARRRGEPEPAAWQSITAWALHRPEAWDPDDRRKKKGQTQLSAALGAYLGREIQWELTDSLETPWACQRDGSVWKVRVNDFPDDVMYALEIDGNLQGKFHDWPENWQRA